jgi:predicted ABC-type ATPase
MPVMIVVAGPSGSGKSTVFPVEETGIDYFVGDDVAAVLNNIYGYVVDPEFFVTHNLSELPQYICDAAVYQGFSSKLLDKVAELGQRFVDYHIEHKKSFAFESTLISMQPMVCAVRSKEAGFQTEMIFLGTQSNQISFERILNRTDMGKLYISEKNSATIREMSLQNLPDAVKYFDEVRIYDNSAALYLLEMVMQTSLGKMITQIPDLPLWLKQALAKNLAKSRDHVSEDQLLAFDYDCSPKMNQESVEVLKVWARNNLARALGYKGFDEMMAQSELAYTHQNGTKGYLTPRVDAAEFVSWNDHDLRMVQIFSNWQEAHQRVRADHRLLEHYFGISRELGVDKSLGHSL